MQRYVYLYNSLIFKCSHLGYGFVFFFKYYFFPFYRNKVYFELWLFFSFGKKKLRMSFRTKSVSRPYRPQEQDFKKCHGSLPEMEQEGCQLCRSWLNAVVVGACGPDHKHVTKDPDEDAGLSQVFCWPRSPKAESMPTSEARAVITAKGALLLGPTPHPV